MLIDKLARGVYGDFRFATAKASPDSQPGGNSGEPAAGISDRRRRRTLMARKVL
jgi:hypothetical protein